MLPTNFCCTEDGLFLIVDVKDGNVKIYDKGVRYTKTLGGKGFGPNEYGDPLFCTYSNRKFIIFDVGQKKFHIYERNGKEKYGFDRVKEIFYPNLAEDFKLVGNQLYVSGHKAGNDKKIYGFFSIDIGKQDTYNYYLPAQMKYGLNSESELNKKIFLEPGITVIGLQGTFDIMENRVYYAWQGDLKIFQINLETHEISVFGKKTSNYVKPYTSKRLVDSVFSRNNAVVREEKSKMSFVRGIFSTQKHVMVIYSKPTKGNASPGSNVMQVYTPGGVFVSEKDFPGEISGLLYFDKAKNFLYSVVSQIGTGDLEESYYIFKYRFDFQ